MAGKRAYVRSAPKNRAKRKPDFWDNVDMSGGPGACWPWMARRDRRGYGLFTFDKKTTFAHREALSRSLGRPILEGYGALHRCNNPQCCNPGCLYEGTQDDNSRDMVASGRSMHGVSHYRAALTEDKVLGIRAGFKILGRNKCHDLADIYGIATTTINDIVRRKTWTHI
jgi:hypothetical protein